MDGKDAWGSADQASYQAWQVKLGFSGDAANGRPGHLSWDNLQVLFVTATPEPNTS